MQVESGAKDGAQDQQSAYGAMPWLMDGWSEGHMHVHFVVWAGGLIAGGAFLSVGPGFGAGLGCLVVEAGGFDRGAEGPGCGFGAGVLVEDAGAGAFFW